VTQQSGNQFDDDLTVGLDNDGSFSTDSIDLFEFTGDEESPIARLKTIILSIDWEINDDILQQLEDELVDLGDIWSDDKVKLIYIQGLSKIGKYIYKEKANAHPNSIKLLITFYHNLEKIVSSDDSMSENEKKQLLIEDVKKFDQLKSQIGPSTPAKTSEPVAVPDTSGDDVQQLKVLKAQVLGIDWEINDIELQKLSDEVVRLEGVFSHSKAKLILLQGIGALSSYINKMRSKSSNTAFTLLHSFYSVLETISSSELAASDEKRLLLAEVDKFKSFKAEISKIHDTSSDDQQDDSIPAQKIAVTEVEPAEKQSSSQGILPVDDSEDETQVASDVNTRLASVFGHIDDDSLGAEGTDESVALAGVNVETEADDDSDEDALPLEDGGVAPALAEAEEESSFSVEKLAGDLAETADAEISEAVVGPESSPQGIDVETEADNESDEEALPYKDGEVAPALSGSLDDGGFDEDSPAIEVDDTSSEDLDDRLDSFFDDEVETSSNEWSDDQQTKSGSVDVDVDTDDEDYIGDILSDVTDSDSASASGEIAAALSDVEEDESLVADEIAAALSDFGEDESSVADELTAALTDAHEEELVQPELELPDQIIQEEESADWDAKETVLSEVDEQPVSEEVLESSIEDNLAFFDDEVPAPEREDTEEAEAIPETVLEEVAPEDNLSFPDEEILTPALEDVEDAGVSEETEEDDNSKDQLSFLDEEIPAPESADSFEKFFNEDSPVEEALAFTDNDEELSPALSDDLYEPDSQDTDKSIDSTGASFFEQIEEQVAPVDDGALAFLSDDAADSTGQENEESDEIQFTVPGELSSEDDFAPIETQESSLDDVIEFNVPGEDDSAEAHFTAADGSKTEDTIVIAPELVSGLVIFEAVDDEVEVDPLPGEEFMDSSDLESDGNVTFLEAHDSVYLVGDFFNLGDLISSQKESVTVVATEHVLAEINRLRSHSNATYTLKIFLQLLSTVCQDLHNVSSQSAQGSLTLIDEIFSGMNSSVSPQIGDEDVQKQLLGCTSQVLLLRQDDSADKQKDTVVDSDMVAIEESGVAAESVAEELLQTDKALGNDEQLKSFVQEEIAEIRRLFLDEITSLRKEITDK